jgi:hypothetical protein
LNRSEVLNAETEDLLWQLSSLRSRIGDRPIDDELIERYQRGKTSDTEGRRLERRLARDERGMERMALLAARRAAGRRPAWRLAASILVGAVATAGLYFSLRTGGVDSARSEIPPYTVSVYGLTDRRGPEVSNETRPGSTVRIVARPAVAPGPGLDVALYRRLDSGALKRIREAEERILVERGTAVLEIEADTLTGTEPGTYELVLLLAPAGGGAAPSTIAGASFERWIRELGAQAHPIELRLLPPG